MTAAASLALRISDRVPHGVTERSSAQENLFSSSGVMR